MKNVAKILTVVCAALLVAGCIGSIETRFGNNGGYPHRISFDKSGGTKVVSGDMRITELSIHDPDGDGASYRMPGEDGVMRIEHEWLTIEVDYYGQQMTMTAAPSHSGRQRKLTVCQYAGYSYIEIIVRQ